MLKLLFASSRSASFELENHYIYYNIDYYDVYLNDILVIEKYRKNVFSLYHLFPGQSYQIRIVSSKESYTYEFQTEEELLTLKVRDFYALGNGVHDDTTAIQAAIMACPKKGRVLIEKGVYLVKSIFLKDDISIELEKGATLLGMTNREDYPVLPGKVPYLDGSGDYYLGTWEGQPDEIFASVITGLSVSNVKIFGEGCIDENSQNSDWWVDYETKRIARRPKGIFLNHCKNIELQGITVKNTPAWNQHPYFCEDIKYIDMHLENPKNSPTTDGCNPESCKRVEIVGCYFSVGDDCIAIKSGKMEMGSRFKRPSEQIKIRNCLMEYGHGGVTLGSEMSGGIKDIEVKQCLFHKTDRGLRIKTQRGRGATAVIDGITFENIGMDNVLAPLVINMFYKAGNDSYDEYRYSKEKQVVDDRTPYLGKFYFKDIIATDVEWGAGIFLGLPEQPIEGVYISNMKFEMKEDAEKGVLAMTPDAPKLSKQTLYFENVREVVLRNVKIIGAEQDSCICKNVGTIIEER